MKKKILAMGLAVALCLGMLPIGTAAAAGSYSDVPAQHWARDSITRATDLGLIQGIGNGKFGLGRNMQRCEFVTILCRMFQWEMVIPAQSGFTDNMDQHKWYYSAVETAFANGAITEESDSFRPADLITREEMAVMLTRALGYNVLAGSVQNYGIPFSDVTTNKGYITIAYDIGMTSGTSGTTFSPKKTAAREEAVTMMMRVYGKYTSKLSWVHGFYAISSYSQRTITDKMDAISLGWSRMEYNSDSGSVLNTTGANGNEWKIPQGFTLATNYFKANDTPANLNVYMDTSTEVLLSDGTRSDPCSAVLLNATSRADAVNAIMKEVTRIFPETGDNIYSGVTIDFEGMKGSALKESFTAFLGALNADLDKIEKRLYVAVPPATPDGIYYDAYDFHAIGEVADKVILMAHDYNATTMDGSLVGTSFTTTPLTPFGGVYYALRAVTDQKTGVADRSKVVLAISIDSVGWTLQDGKVASADSVRLTPSAIYERLTDNQTKMYYSERYRNPYMNYINSDGTNTMLWYEDERSVDAKIELARMFDVNGISLWRIGTIPNYTSGAQEIYYDIWSKVLSKR